MKYTKQQLIGRILQCNPEETYYIGPSTGGKKDQVDLITDNSYGGYINYDISIINEALELGNWKLLNIIYEIY